MKYGKKILESIIEKEREDQYKIRIFDIKGRPLRNLETTTRKIQIDMGSESGLYFLNIQKSDGTSYTKKICVF